MLKDSIRLNMLKQMGIVVWKQRNPEQNTVLNPKVNPELNPGQTQEGHQKIEASTESKGQVIAKQISRNTDPKLKSESKNVNKLPDNMQPEVSGNRNLSEHQSTPLNNQSSTASNELSSTKRIGQLAKLKAKVAACEACSLYQSRTQTVFGVGDSNAKILFVGEAPGADEDKQGEPFVGRAGRLLTSMLLAIGLSRDDVYIANILKCRPPANRDPNAAEISECTPFLRQQIDLIRPQVIVAVGRIAAQHLLDTKTPIGKLRGQIHQFPDTAIPLIITYHPAYLLRSPGQKAQAWNDLKLIREYL